MRKITLLACLATLSFSNLSLAMTLEEALVAGYQQDEELKLVRNNFLAEIEAYPQALSDFLPNVTAEISTNRRTSENTNNQIPDTEKRFDKALTIRQNIFKGGASVANLKAAQDSFRVARAKYYNSEQGVFDKEIQTYLNCIEAQEKYEIAKISVKSNQTQLDATQEKFRLGESTETEISSAKGVFATAQANESQAYGAYESAKVNFFKTFAVMPDTLVMPDLPLIGYDNKGDFINHVLASNPSLEQARHELAASKATLHGSKGALLPEVNFEANIAKSRLRGPNEQRNQLNNSSGTTTTTALRMTVPILSRGGIEYSRIRTAKYRMRQAAINLDNTIKKVRSEAESFWVQNEAAKLALVARQEAVRAATVAYEGIVQEEQLGSKNILDVLQQEERLNNAKRDLVETRKNRILLAYKLKTLTGQLTAKGLNLPVDYFSPEAEFKKVKFKIVGF